MRRDKVGTPPPAGASLSAEPVTQIDNLPVRATAPAHLVGDGNPSRDDRPERPERREGSDRSDRHERRERSGRDDRGERGGRGRRDDRGRGRDRSGERRNQDDRPPATTWEAPGEESTSETDFEPAESTILPDESPDLAGQEEVDEEVEETGRNPRQRRGPRFEAADDEATDRSHLIQEFKPSRHADRSTSPSRQTTSEKKGSLMGWIKSVFTGGDQSTQSPEAKPSAPPSGDRRSGDRSGDRDRGSRSRGQGGRGPNQGSPSGGTDSEGRPRRRRRRSGGGGGGGRGRGGRPDGNRRPPRDS